ncbi:MAG TPA: hypothetical protein VFQ68_39940, partial [Streptosporangiaceae bacterium]|nr:hypothetical protein [Streptosporangiaceae bacterium]
LDERQIWEIERRAAIREQQVARAEAAEERAYLERQAEAEAARSARVMTRMLSGEPVPTIGDVLARWRDAPEDPAPRDRTAEYGSAENPAVFIDGSEIRPAAQRAAAARSALLARARQPDPFMLGQVELLERRRAAGRPEASRSQAERVNGTAVAMAERLGLGEGVQRDAHGERMQCMMTRTADGGFEHHPHGGRCVSPGGNIYRRWPA